MTEPQETTPTNVLLTLIVALLAPMFLSVCGSDIALAQAAALETVNDYRAQNNAGLIAVALIVAYGLATLSSLSQSMEDNITPSMALRLRGNANALNRSAEQNRQALKRSLDDAAFYPPMTETGIPALDNDPLTEDTIIADAAAAQKRAAQAHTTPDSPLTTAEQQNRAMWANAMAEVANDFTASLATMRPDQRRVASIQAAALTNSANALLSGAPLPTFDLPIPR
jgi:hypothetical protein